MSQISPRIYKRDEHNISRKDIDKDALYILYRLKESGYKAYLVGGSVRDLLLGRIPKDFDVGTDATPAEIKKLFKHSRIIGKRFQLVHVLFKGGKYIEVSTFRKSRSAIEESCEPNNIFGTPEEDAFRRDLTINALFYNIEDFTVIDYVQGMEDLKNGVIRIIGEPEVRIDRDPVRMMRAIRHAARTGFIIEEKTWNAIKNSAHKIRTCSIARVRDELLKDLTSGCASAWLGLSIESHLFHHLLPYYNRFLRDETKAPILIRYLYACFNKIDEMSTNISLQDLSLLIALLKLPALLMTQEWYSLSREKPKFLYNEVKSLTRDILYPYEFKGHDLDRSTMILAGYWAVDACIKNNSWPRRVTRKDTLSQSIVLYDLVKRELEAEINYTQRPANIPRRFTLNNAILR